MNYRWALFVLAARVGGKANAQAGRDDREEHRNIRGGAAARRLLPDNPFLDDGPGVQGQGHGRGRPPRSASTIRPGPPYDREAAEERRRADFARVQSNHARAFSHGKSSTRTPSQEEVDAIVHAEPQPGVPTQVGMTLAVPDGRVGLGGPKGVYELEVAAPDAAAMRLHFVDFDLPAGAEAWIYCDGDGEVFGPYVGRGLNGDGDFWSHTIHCDAVVVQVDQKEDLSFDADGSHEHALTVSEVAYLVQMTDVNRRERKLAFCSANENCVMHGGSPEIPGTTDSCLPQSVPQDVKDARYAVAHILFQVGSTWYQCSGGLINDTANSAANPLWKPYFLTANHCFSTQASAATLETYFMFWDDCATSGTSCSGRAANPSTLGADILYTSTTSDVMFCQLREPAPVGVAFLGWDNVGVAFSNGTPLYRFSHPKGSPQAFSAHSVDTTKGTCQTLPRGQIIYTHDEYGATEGGSSGSPILNAFGQAVGQLYGACGTNVNDPCDANSNASIDGALANYYSAIEQWLDPCTVDADCADYVVCYEPLCVNRECEAGNPILPCCGNNICDVGEDVFNCAIDGCPFDCGSSCKSLETTWAGGNGQQGNFFWVEALQDLVVVGFDIHAGNSGTGTVNIYEKEGQYTTRLISATQLLGPWFSRSVLLRPREGGGWSSPTFPTRWVFWEGRNGRFMSSLTGKVLWF